MTTHLFTYPKVVPVPRPGPIVVTPAPAADTSSPQGDSSPRAA